MILAYRLFGNFHWPPSDHAPSSGEERSTSGELDKQCGTVEIYFAVPTGASLMAAVLRWCPALSGKGGAAEVGQELPTDSLFDKTQAEGEQWFKDHKTSGGSLWLKLGPRRTTYKFCGAFLLEQLDPEAYLQWPLVEACSYEAGSTTFSGLTLYQNDRASFRFDLHLPLPVQRATPRNSRKRTAAFPFCAEYRAQVGTYESVWNPRRLFAGWFATKATAGKTSYELYDSEWPDDARLGKFGFATRRYVDDVSRKYFAKIYREFGDGTHQEPEDYWPDVPVSSVCDILETYGFEIGEFRGGRRPRGPVSPRSLSVRFEPNKLIYRIAATAGEIDSGDFCRYATEENRWKLRLSEELIGPFAAAVHYDPEDLAGWLDIGRELYVDCELSWRVNKDDVWSVDRNRLFQPEIRLRLVWSDELTRASLPKLPLRTGLLELADRSFHVTRNALMTSDAALPHSFLPSLSVDTGVKARFALSGRPLQAYVELGSGLVLWGARAHAGFWRRPRMRLTLAHEVRDLEENTSELDVTLSDIAFFQTEGVELSVALKRDEKWVRDSELELSAGQDYFASYLVDLKAVRAPAEPSKANKNSTWSARLGALQFTDRTREDFSDPTTRPQGQLWIGGSGQDRSSEISHVVFPHGTGAVQINFSLPVSRIEQVAIDVLRGDRSGRPAPLLIPLEGGGTEKSEKPQYWLAVTERISPRDDRWLEAEIIENSPEDQARSFVVLSHEPFSVLKFTHHPLGGRGGAEAASVAFYSSDTRVWQYRVVSDTYHYVLPPQAIGEGSDKPGRMEIHDPVAGDKNPHRPYAAPLSPKGGCADSEVPVEPGGLETQDPAAADTSAPGPEAPEPSKAEPAGMRRSAVEFKLTPSAELWIRPSDVERGYFMPESASFEIFRQRGEYGLGAQLAYFRGEFLYGMPVGIDVGRENGPGRGARVAEIEALVGRPAGRTRPGAEAEHENRWNALRSAIAGRPERLEIWARDLDSPVDFTPARFSAGVRFALRGTALHRHPLKAEEPTKAEGQTEGKDENPYMAVPLVGLQKPVASTVLDKPRHHPQGLSGGALWPLESSILFDKLVDSPASSGGTLENVALSPIGGDGVQKAEYLGGLVTIVSETRNGQVERQQVEVIGRICAFWHRAKHVVVYERTVNPSAQFAPRFQQDPCRSRSRRPILRKVREYIEVLQPERTYPDFGNAAPRTSGFLERVRFNSSIINVDSAWGSELPERAWKIPLWNRASARQRPQVYPRPDVAFITTAEGEGDRPVVSQECLDPDYLYFFSDFNANTSDTNLWPARLGLDYPNVPASKTMTAAAGEGSSGSETSERRRSVGRFLPGSRQFTWRLAPAARKTAINAGRAQTPVYVGLDSVTFMRASHVGGSTSALDQPVADALKVSALIRRDPAAPYAAVPYWPRGAAIADVPRLDEYRRFADEAGELAKAINSKDAQAVQALHAKFKKDWEQIKEELADNFALRIKGAGLPDFNAIARDTAKASSFCDTLRRDTLGHVKRKEMLLRMAVSDIVAETETLLGSLSENPPPRQQLQTLLVESAHRRIRPLFDEASQDIGGVEESVEKAFAALIDLEAEIEAVFVRAGRRIDEFVAGYDRDKPWSPGRRAAFRDGMAAAASNVAEDLAAAVDELRQRLAVELNSVCQALGGQLARMVTLVLTQLWRGESSANRLAYTIEQLLERDLRALEQSLQTLAQNVGDGAPLSRIEKLITDAGRIDDKGRRERVIHALKTLEATRQGAADLVARARQHTKDIDANAGQMTADVRDTVAATAETLRSLLDALTASVVTLSECLHEGLGSTAEDVARDLRVFVVDAMAPALERVEQFTGQTLAGVGNAIDAVVAPLTGSLAQMRGELMAGLREIPAALAPVVADLRGSIGAARKAFGPEALVDSLLRKKVLEPAVAVVLAPLPEPFDPKQHAGVVRALILSLEEEVGKAVRDLTDASLDVLEDIAATCDLVGEGTQQVREWLDKLKNDPTGFFLKRLSDAGMDLETALGQPLKDENVQSMLAAVAAFDRSVRGLRNDMSRAQEAAAVYGDRVMDAVARLDDGGLMAVPSNILKLYSAVTSAPELAALKSDIDRMRAQFDEIADAIETTETTALFNQLGDGLKGLGLSFPYQQIGDRLLPAELSKLDIGQVFRNFGGAKLDRLFEGYKLPAGMRDAIRVTHDFDRKQARAWVQVDINAPMPGRRSLFSVGAFKVDFVDMYLKGQVRLEADAKGSEVTQTGYGHIGTRLEMIVAGQPMVSFVDFAMRFTRERGMEIDFDPRNIRLNPQFKFIQDFLSTLFGGDVPGGVKVIRQGGMPVGVEHEFVIPPMSLNFGTSGVSNISIENRFELIAYPDFMLADRFNLSTAERPFIFSIFVIGGTGYVQIEARYQPVNRELMVIVEAAVGGSAALAFACGPFSGQVFITLSGSMAYRKLIGKPGGGLAIAVVLVIAGHVDVAGIVTVGITLVLRMTYRENGQIDGEGTLSVTIRISRFFKLKARANARYQLRGATSPPSQEESKAVEAARKAAKAIEDARS